MALPRIVHAANYHKLPRETRRLIELPTEPYIGLDLAEAERFAAAEDRVLRVILRPDAPRRADLRRNRVNIVLGEDNRVTKADAG